jgi:hypothetical protein
MDSCLQIALDVIMASLDVSLVMWVNLDTRSSKAFKAHFLSLDSIDLLCQCP